MGAIDLSHLLWPDSSQRRQPQQTVKLRDRFSGGVVYIGESRIDAPDRLRQEPPDIQQIDCGELAISPTPVAVNDNYLGPADVDHALVFRLRIPTFGSYWYYITGSVGTLTFTPYHSSYGDQALVYDGGARTAGVKLPADRFATVVVRFSGAETAFFVDGVKTSSSGRIVSSGAIWYLKAFNLTGTAPKQSLLAWLPGTLSDAECIKISEEPYSSLFEPSMAIAFDFPASIAGPISWSSLTASGITPTTATLTLGGIVR